MTDDYYRPRRFTDEAISLINEPIATITDDAVILPCVRKEPPLRAVMLNAMAHTQVLLGHLEHGVPAQTSRQRAAVRALFERSQRQVQALAACLDLLTADR
jgi:hypothetical protein